MATKKKLTKEEILKLIDIQNEKVQHLTLTQIAEIFKNINMPYATSYKNAYAVIELVPNQWKYYVLGFTKSSGIMTCLVDGFCQETGSQYLEELTQYPLKLKILEQPIPHNDLADAIR